MFYSLLILFCYNYYETIRKLPRKCIPTKYTCDGVKDCKDGSDEIECSCLEDEFQCSRRVDGASVYHNLPQCIPKNLKNEGTIDCLSNKDEDR